MFQIVSHTTGIIKHTVLADSLKRPAIVWYESPDAKNLKEGKELLIMRRAKYKVYFVLFWIATLYHVTVINQFRPIWQSVLASLEHKPEKSKFLNYSELCHLQQ